MNKEKSFNQGAIGTIVIFGVIAFIGAATLIGTNLVKDRDKKQTSETKAEWHYDITKDVGSDDGWVHESCFSAGTKITMSDGTKKNIEEVKVGDSILSFDNNQKLQPATVYEMESPIREGYYNVLLEDKTVLKVTDEHPLYFKNTLTHEEGWASFSPKKTKDDAKMKVKQLTLDSFLKKEDGSWSKIIKIKYISGSVQTYNLKSVQGNSFFAEGIWAHNKGGNQSPRGHLDAVSCNFIEGWSCDLDNWARDALSIHFHYDNGILFGSTLANLPREAGVGDHCSGNRNHGFKFITPDVLKDGLSHEIYATGMNTVGGGVNTLLTNSPMTLTCSTCSVSVVKNANKVTISYTGRANNRNIRLWLERIDYKQIGDGKSFGEEKINSEKKYYYLLDSVKSTNYSLVDEPFVLPKTLPTYGNYWVHCDTTGGNDKCSGSPACKYEGVSGGGFYGCEGWSSCSNKDRATFSFTQPTPTATPTPTPTSTPTPTPTSTPTPTPTTVAANTPTPTPTPTTVAANTPTLTTAPTNTESPSCTKKAQGDANCDDAIDIKDYEIISSALQGNDISDLCDDVEDCSADINGDGNVTILDYTIWLSNYLDN